MKPTTSTAALCSLGQLVATTAALAALCDAGQSPQGMWIRKGRRLRFLPKLNCMLMLRSGAYN